MLEQESESVSIEDLNLSDLLDYCGEQADLYRTPGIERAVKSEARKNYNKARELFNTRVKIARGNDEDMLKPIW